MQPPLPPPAASTGADGAAGSASGALEVMVKSSAKKSIGVIVCVVVWFDRCDGTVLMLKGSSTLSIYTHKVDESLWGRMKIMCDSPCQERRKDN
jgi:hypothetical protein